ncbi:MAG: hypothetical protein FJY74_00480 [Candidatus Eisenbacteria bacterium]|nr:hypothetical protein [Candidatus Eisenbacteria bacterium]
MPFAITFVLRALAVVALTQAEPGVPAAADAADTAAARPAAAPGPRALPLWPSGDGLTVRSDAFEASEGPGGRIALFEGSVVLEREGARLVGRRGVYRESLREFLLYGGVSGEDDGAAVAAETLRYHRDSDVVTLSGRASYADTSATVTARRIRFFRAERVAVCVGDAVAVDADGSSELSAERIVYDFDRSEVRASGEPVITTTTDEGELDLTVRADVIELSRERSELRAFGAVAIVREDVKAGARAATLFLDDEVTFLEGDPFVSRERDQLTGERIFVAAPDGTLSRVRVTGRAAATYRIEPESPEDEPEWGRVAGDSLTMFFEGGDPVLTVVRGRAQSEHSIGSSGKRNTVAARELTVAFADGKIERAVFRGSAVGSYVFPPEGGRQVPPAPVPGEDASGVPPATPPAELETVDYRASEITYHVPDNRIVLADGATVEYQGTVLRAEEVVFDPDSEVLTASGNPDFTDAGERLIGSGLWYDLGAKTGSIDGGATTFEDGLCFGDRIERDADGSLRVRGGSYTTCSASEPHYHLTSRKMKIHLNDKVIARPVVLHIGRLPVLALPFYVFPIRKGRQSGFLIPQIEFGASEERGRFIRNFGYYWAPNDYWDAMAWADYYDQARWIAHLEARYALRYVLSGSVRTSFMQETLAGRRRWDLTLDHKQELGRNWTAGASGDFRSDASYATDANQSIQESLNRSLRSQLWVRGRWSGLSTGVTLDRREELDLGTVSELLPKIDVSGSQRPLLSVPEGTGGLRGLLGKVSYSWDARAVNDRSRTDGGATSRQAAGLGLSLRAPGKLLGWLTVSPHASVAQAWYDRDKLGNRFPSRLTYGAGVSASTAIYGTFFPRVGPLEGVRHIIEPSATYSWTPEFARYFDDGVDRFYSFGGFGSTPRAREAVSVSLVNKLQLKLKRAGGEVRKLDNFLRFSVSSAYDLRADDEPWADIVSRAEMRPGDAVSLSWDARHDPYTGRLGGSSITASVSLRGERSDAAAGDLGGPAGSGDPLDELRRAVASRSVADAPARRPWDASLAFRYSRGAAPGNETYWADATVALSPTAKWRVNWTVHYDLREREVASQEYVIHRDLHCWEAQFVRRYYAGEWQYYFRINIKALPDVQLETGRKTIYRRVN